MESNVNQTAAVAEPAELAAEEDHSGIQLDETIRVPRQRQLSNGAAASAPLCGGERHQQHPSGECRMNLSDGDAETGWDSSEGYSMSDCDMPHTGRDSDSDCDELPPRISLLGWRLPRSYLLWLVNAFNAWRLWLFLTGFSLVTAVFSSTVIIANNLISLGLLSARYDPSLAVAETRDWPDFALFVLWWVASVVPFVMLSCLLVQLCSPIAEGSGIPELRCFLSNAYREKSLLGGSALIARVLGLILALNSGLPVGMLGPNVHMSCCIAHLLMFDHRLHRQVRPDPKTAAANGRFGRCLRGARVLASAAFKTLEPWTWEHQEMMCVAAAVGVACTFNAPISGVLFSIELTTKYFAVNTYWRGFYCNIVATMAMSILMTGMRHSSIAGEYLIGSAIAMAKSEDRNVQTRDLASFAGLGLLAGVVSVGFLRFYRLCLKTGSRRLVAWAERRLPWRLRRRDGSSKDSYWRPRLRALAYCLFASLFMALLTCPAHRLGRGSLSQVRQFDQLRQLFEHTSWRRHLLAPEPSAETDGNSTAAQDSTAGFSPHLQPGGDFTALMLLLLHFAALKLILAAVTLTLAIPTGVFMPTFVAGAAIGRLYGELSGHDHPIWFVLAGAAAFSGAATGTLSTSLIVFEVTGDISLIIPTILSVLIANFTMHICRTLSFYDLGIRIKRLPQAPITCPKLQAKCARVKVSQVMLPPESTVRIGLSDTNDALRRLLRRHPHFESLPLVKYDDEAGVEAGNSDDKV